MIKWELGFPMFMFTCETQSVKIHITLMRSGLSSREVDFMPLKRHSVSPPKDKSNPRFDEVAYVANQKEIACA